MGPGGSYRQRNAAERNVDVWSNSTERDHLIHVPWIGHSNIEGFAVNYALCDSWIEVVVYLNVDPLLTLETEQ
jgi:hypothetical protein